MVTMERFTPHGIESLTLDEGDTRLRLLADALPVLIAYVDKDLRYQFNNAAYADWFGRSPDELQGMRVREVLGEAAYATVRPHLEAALAGQPVCYEAEVTYRQRGRRFVRAQYVPHRDAEGDIAGFYSLVQDLTEARRIEDELRAQERRLAAIVSHAADAIIAHDGEGAIQAFNPAAEEIFGYRSEEMIGRAIDLLLPGSGQDESNDYLVRYRRQSQERGTHRIGEFTARRQDGSYFPVELTVSEVVPGRVYTAIIRDVSVRKNLEREVVEAVSDEKRRIAQDLHDGIGQELTGLRHMVRTLSDALEEKGLPEAELARRIGEVVTTAHQHVRAVSRGLMPVPVDGEGLAAALADLASATHELNRVDCHFHCDPPDCTSDDFQARHLYRIAQEAVANAVRHGRASRIDIRFCNDGRFLTLTIDDNGRGISEQSKKRNGLGLKVARYRAGQIGATLHIGPGEAGGTRVVCRLPASRENADEHDGAEE
jgi:PAS domain S-box-containing protein